MERRT
jgi:hypothetical protein